MKVVLPAPLGPMRPTTSPRSSLSETSSTAVRPPKRTVTEVAINWSGAFISARRAACTARSGESDCERAAVLHGSRNPVDRAGAVGTGRRDRKAFSELRVLLHREAADGGKLALVDADDRHRPRRLDVEVLGVGG